MPERGNVRLPDVTREPRRDKSCLMSGFPTR